MFREARYMATAGPLVMVVNDDEAMRDSLGFALRLEGADVRLHHGGAGLLADGALPGSVCLVLAYHLPEMDGFEILRRVRAMNLTIPAIMLTSAATPAMQDRAREAGVWRVLEKPVMDGALVEAVTGLLREIT
jgi:two-component system, LuxR family, response regulator FixJ